MSEYFEDELDDQAAQNFFELPITDWEESNPDYEPDIDDPTYGDD